MKKKLVIILLLSVVSVAVSAKESKKDRGYAKSEEAAAVCHINLKEEIDKDAKHGGKTIKKAMGSQKIKVPKEAKFTYKKCFTASNGNVDTTGKNEMLQFPFEGNLTITDIKANKKSKYIVKGSFNVNKKTTKDKKKKEIIRVTYTPAKKQPSINLILVPYFESEALKKAEELVKAYYNQHKEFAKVSYGKVEPCENGYKVTTTRICYKDEQRYIGNEGMVIFTVQKNEKLEDFRLLEQLEEHLTDFDNTPAPIEEPTQVVTIDKESISDNKSNKEKLEQIVVNSFKFNSIDLSNFNKEQLDQAAQILLSDKELEIELLGHTCNLGTKETNYTFGIMRAKMAKKYLVDKGVEPNRIYVHSYGENKPIVSNTTIKHRAQNRRVEIKVIK